MERVRTLFLLRHAKSSWADPTLDDHDRPLAPPAVAPRGLSPITSAPKLYVRSSCCARRHGGRGDPRRADASTRRPGRGRDQGRSLRCRRRTRSCAGSARSVDTASVMIVGHNPGVHDWALSSRETQTRPRSHGFTRSSRPGRWRHCSSVRPAGTSFTAGQAYLTEPRPAETAQMRPVAGRAVIKQFWSARVPGWLR